jgi:Uncharacterized secreted protein
MRRIATAGSLALLAMMFLLHPGQARAATSCSASVGGISFGTVDPSGTTDVSAVVTLSCDSSGLQALGTVYVNACLLLGTGSGGSSLSPRTLRNGFGDTIEYNVYRGSGYVNVWGNTPATWLPLQLSIPVILLGGSGSTSATVQARIPSQPGLAAGTYSSSFDGIHTELRYRYDEPLVLIGSSMPASCESGGDGGATGIPFAMFTVTASVADQCVISTATDLDFGTVPGLISAPIDQTSSVTLACTRRTPWHLALDDGQNAAGGVRRMRLGSSSSHVAYELYRDPGRTQRWGGAIGADTAAGTGEGTPQTVTVYGRVPAPQAVPAGQYQDVVRVTITY